MITNEDKMIEEAISKPLTANEKLRQLQSTEKYIEKFEQVLKEREEEEQNPKQYSDDEQMSDGS